MRHLVIPQDKANHAIYGALTSLVVQAGLLVTGAHTLGFRHKDVAFAAVIVVALGKEIYDKYMNRQAAKAGLPPPHNVEWWDFLATVLGGAAIHLASAF